MATEKRLIDANALKSLFYDRYDRAFMQMHSREKREYWDGVCCGVNWGLNTITDAPTVDAVEVVRCHNCQYHEPCKPYNKVWCPKMGRYMKEDGFCSEGERKDND